MKSKIFILLFGIVCLYIAINRESEWKDKLYVWDQAGYHHYLPATILYQDLGEMKYYPDIEQKYQTSPSVNWYGLFLQPNGRYVNKYPAGVAIHNLPFFLAAQVYANNSSIYPADGYSLPYQYSTIIGTIFWVLLGLWLLRATLKSRFSDNIVLLTLLGLSLGTNLYSYTAFMQGMSHPYSFFHFSAILYLSNRLGTRYNKIDVLLLGLLIGLTTITRPTGIIILIIPLLWGVYSWSSLKQKLKNGLANDKLKYLILSCIVCLTIMAIQMLYWHYTTTHWLYYSYGDEGFVWSQPAIIKGLFSFRKGWFVYSPVAFIGILSLIFLYKKQKTYLLSYITFFGVTFYITFSWWSWWYGGSFGCRALIESSALLAIPLAIFINFIYTRGYVIKIIGSTVLLFFCILIPFQTYQYSKNILHCDRMSSKHYFHTFFNVEPADDIEPYLLPEDEYFDEVNKRLKESDK